LLAALKALRKALGPVVTWGGTARATFAMAIGYVIGARTKEEMIGAHALGVITLVANKTFLWD